MMKFDKEFPSLKGKGISEQVGTRNMFKEPYYFEHVIQKHCIDKQRVKKIFKDAVETLKNNLHHLGRDLKGEQQARFERDLNQRFDEIGLLYSDLFDMSFNESMKEMGVKK